MPENFPNPSVMESYTNPTVHTFDPEAFKWTSPQLESISIYLHRKLGWPADKVDQKVIPVLKSMNSRSPTHQTQLESYFSISNIPSKMHKSKRVAQALASTTEIVKPSVRSLKSKRGGRKNRSRVEDFL